LNFSEKPFTKMGYAHSPEAFLFIQMITALEIDNQTIETFGDNIN
jgi:hypothetical protein